MDVRGRLDELVLAADVAGLAAWFSGASPDDLAAARSWYRRGAVRKVLDRDPNAGGLEAYRRRGWFEVVLVVGLAGPAAAAGAIRWTGCDSHLDKFGPDWRELAIATAVARGERWCREFVPLAADAVRGRRDLQLHAGVVYDLLAPVVAAHDLPAPSGRAFVQGWIGRVAWAPSAAEVCERLADDPLLPDSFHHLLASGVVHQLKTAAEVAALLVAQGRLDRDRLIAQAFELLTSEQPAGTQRTLAAMLTRLELRADEIPAGSAFLHGLIATCQGAVGALLLPFALNAVVDDAELVELCSIVAGRPERAQLTTLLRALDGAPLRDRLGVPAVVEGLVVCVQSAHDDPATFARAERVLARLAPERVASEPDPPAARTGLWDATPPGDVVVAGRIGEWPELTHDALSTFEWIMRYEDRPPCTEPWREVRSAIILAAVVRHASVHGAGATWTTLAERLPTGTDNHDFFSEAVIRSRPGDGATPYLDDVALVAKRRWDRTCDPTSLAYTASAFRFLLVRESFERLGRTPCLLSTPSHLDGSISFEALVPRLHLNQGATFGPLDLLQTLLRLRPVDPAELVQLDGLTIPLDETLNPADRPCLITDAVDAFRTWVTGGGLPDADPAPSSTIDRDAFWVPRGVVPIAPELFGTPPPDLLNAWGWNMSPHFLQVVPRWADLVVGGRPYAAADNWAPSIRAMAGREVPAGRVTCDALLQTMTCPTAKYRPQAATDTLTLMGEGRFDPDVFTVVALQRLDQDVLSLSRVVPIWDLIATGGGLRQLWPVAVAVAAAASIRLPRPAGLADLLAFLTRYVAEVPDVELPADVRALADHRGQAKYVHEARALVAAVA